MRETRRGRIGYCVRDRTASATRHAPRVHHSTAAVHQCKVSSSSSFLVDFLLFTQEINTITYHVSAVFRCFPSEVMLPDIESPSKKPQMSQKPASNRGVCPSVCKVCRHPATGYHYDVPSCNGCKTFFRRSILDGRKYTCLKMKKCMSGDEPVGECFNLRIQKTFC